MAKNKTEYKCTECGERFPKWSGKCLSCGQWNSIVEVDKEQSTSHHKGAYTGYAGDEASQAEIISLKDVNAQEHYRYTTGLNELDRVLGGGIVKGSVTLVGGDPGVGKSTILLQVIANIAQNQKVLYISGEESSDQVKMRAERLQLEYDTISFLPETNIEKIISRMKEFKPDVVVFDSVQTLYTQESASAPGTSSQVKEVTAHLTRFCKQNSISSFIVGHVTKDGAIAGPKVLEHIVDAVLYFEGEQGSRYRMIRAIKNRFGEVNELGIFAMLDTGLKEVKNPSALFLSNYDKEVSGTSLMVTKEGTRPLLLEIQTLLAKNPNDNVRRMSLGVDRDRLILILALLQRKANVQLFNYDVYVSVVGGVKISETASDLPLMLAIISSFKEKPLSNKMVAFGEVGLTGEIRPVPNGEERIKEAVKHGMETLIVPKMNLPKKSSEYHKKATIIGVSDIDSLVKLDILS